MRGSSQPNGSPVSPYGGGEVCFFILYRQNFAHAQFCHFPRQGKARIIALFLGFPLPEKKFSKLHFLRQKLSAASRLPPGGKLSAERTDEGRNLFSLIRDYRYCNRPVFFRNFFRNIRKIKNVLRPLIENFDIKFQSKMSCAPHSLRFRSAPSPQGEG